MAKFDTYVQVTCRRCKRSVQMDPKRIPLMSQHRLVCTHCGNRGADTNIVTYNEAGYTNPNYVESGNTIIAAANVGDYSAMNAWIAQHAPSAVSFSDPFFLT